MLWQVFAFLSAIFGSASAIIEKKTLFQEHAMEFSAVLGVVNATLALPFFFFVHFRLLTVSNIFIILLAAVLSSFGFLFTARAVRHMELSVTSPLMVLAPAFTAILALLFLNEKLSIFQWSGIGTLTIGSYILQLESGQKMFEPFENFAKSKYIHYLLLGLLFYAFSSLVDRHALSTLHIEVPAYMAFLHLFMAIIFLGMISFYYDGFKGIQNGLEKSGKYLVTISLLTLAYRLAQIIAMKLYFAGPVIAIKRTSSLFTTIIGGEIFQEKNLFRKAIACMVMIVGVILVVVK